MIIECTSCHSRYQYDEDRFERKPSKKIKCAKCSTVFEIHNPAFAPSKPSPDRGDATAPSPDATHAAKPKKIEESTTESEIPSDPRIGSKNVKLALPAGKRLSLAIIDGPGAGSVFRMEKPKVTLGRSGADFTLDDTEASRQHASVEARDTVYLLSDMGSTNGTLVNGQKISEITELQDKGEFQIGSTTIMLIVTDDA